MIRSPDWLAPRSLEEALALRAQHGDEATVVAGGTFVGILMNQRLLAPAALLSLQSVPDLAYIELNGDLRLGAMTRHRAVERSEVVQRDWPALGYAFSVVANTRVRNQATVGGVLADADYASDPPAMLCALDARAIACGPQGTRGIPIEELIVGHYATSLRPDELLVEVRVPRGVDRAVYRKFRSRSSEDRPCVSVAAAIAGAGRRDSERARASRNVLLPGPTRTRLRVVVGAVAERPQYFPEICSLAEGEAITHELAVEIGRRYAEAIDPISDARGSAEYRRRVIAVEVRRALEALA